MPSRKRVRRSVVMPTRPELAPHQSEKGSGQGDPEKQREQQHRGCARRLRDHVPAELGSQRADRHLDKAGQSRGSAGNLRSDAHGAGNGRR